MPDKPIPDEILREAEAADVQCQRDNCSRMDCNGFLCVRALEAVYRAALEDRSQ